MQRWLLLRCVYVCQSVAGMCIVIAIQPLVSILSVQERQVQVSLNFPESAMILVLQWRHDLNEIEVAQMTSLQ